MDVLPEVKRKVAKRALLHRIAAQVMGLHESAEPW
jgi:hypothetical protein